MILTGAEIRKQVRLDRIMIEPFNLKQINPNSYNYRLGNTYLEAPVARESNRQTEIPSSGLLLRPGKVYLSHTYERIGSRHFVTSLMGRSSVGRLGLFLQISADLGQLGDAHQWTLELKAVQPLIVYPQMVIGQVSFWRPHGKRDFYDGYYTKISDPAPCVYPELGEVL